MKDNTARLREMSEDTIRVLEVAEQMVNSTYLRLCGLLHESEQENERLRQRVEKLETLLGQSAGDTVIVDRRVDDTQTVGPKICTYSTSRETSSRELAETLEF